MISIITGALGCAGGRHRGPPSDHFDGRRFHNLPDHKEPSFADFVRWRRTRKLGVWPDFVDVPSRPPPPPRVQCPDLRVTFVNHSTLLVQTAGLNILTDPIWSKRASPLQTIGPRRRRPPGIAFEDLPAIDVVVVSHNHYDHMDVRTLRRLWQEHHPRIFVGLGVERVLARKRIGGGEAIDWDQTIAVDDGVRLTGVNVRHWSARGIADRNRGLWLGYVFETPCGAIYFAGDTADGEHFDHVGKRFGPIRLAMIPIGAYEPRWFMQAHHIDPAQAASAHRRLRASTSVAMHFGTFPLADDGRWEPTEELAAVLGTRNHPSFWVLSQGEGRWVPPAP